MDPKSLTELVKKVKRYQKNTANPQSYNDLIIRLNIGLERMKDDIKNLPKDKVKEKKYLDYFKNLVENIADIGEKYEPGEEIETSYTPPRYIKKTAGQELKIMTPSQLIARLPILLSQVKAGNNSQKLKNEIRQILYSLYG